MMNLASLSFRSVLLLTCVLTTNLLTACVDIETDLLPVDTSVEPVLVGRDCSPIVLGFGFGHNTVEQARRTDLKHAADEFEGMNITTPITKVRVISLEEFSMVLAGVRCVKVIGEPDPTSPMSSPAIDTKSKDEKGETNGEHK
jgi:hypothetical protein